MAGGAERLVQRIGAKPYGAVGQSASDHLVPQAIPYEYSKCAIQGTHDMDPMLFRDWMGTEAGFWSEYMWL
ncbi:hypothetical protein UY3_07227 [Chelonia mydas]|uniref:Uncharacterized protein n=1 Tax=Chelonia mydas TaxID=8469 RepID=M7BEK1_CHEMY|nr:hypothetical protein UY3_07227 [Chelonia mydas]